MRVSIIAAVASNRVIGKDNSLIWHLPDDMRFFKEMTQGHCVITGRKNYESIPARFRPLPNRTNIVVTRQENYEAPGAIVAGSLDEALEIARAKGETEVFIIGGGQLYHETLQRGLADQLYLTELHAAFEGDTFFPVFDKNDWHEISRIPHIADEKHAFPFDFTGYKRKR